VPSKVADSLDGVIVVSRSGPVVSHSLLDERLLRMTNGVVQTVDSAEFGFDPGRLARTDRHFAAYVDDGRLAGWQLVVSRRGQVVHASTYGKADIASGRPFSDDAIVRMFSMTKPVTSVAIMMLVEEGRIKLTDPIATWLPAFANMQVYREGPPTKPSLRPAAEPIRLWHLLTHTAGLTYGFHYTHPVDAIYREAGFAWGAPAGADLAECCDRWAALPLLFDPGTEWNYSVATDVLGRLVEVVSGQSLDVFFADRILGPLAMHDTAFSVPEHKAHRFTTLYIPDQNTGAAIPIPADRPYGEAPRMLSGGGGLVGSAADYIRFCHMLLGEGSLDGVRLLGSRTLRYMTRNHLPGGADLEQIGRPGFNEASYHGIGFGLGFSVVDDPVKNKVLSSKGEFAWGGAASTAFWIDPAEELCVVFLTQLLPSSTHPIRPELKQLVYQALT
jgi:CubicO group peptidase (beta-lactamase class C family)